MGESNQATEGRQLKGQHKRPGSGLGPVSGDPMQKTCTSSRSAKASRLELVTTTKQSMHENKHPTNAKQNKTAKGQRICECNNHVFVFKFNKIIRSLKKT